MCWLLALINPAEFVLNFEQLISLILCDKQKLKHLVISNLGFVFGKVAC